MNIKKQLKQLGIEPLEEIKTEEKNNIIKNVTEKILSVLPQNNSNYQDILEKLNNAKMYKAKINSSLGQVSYFYHNKSIYFDEKLDLNYINESIIHECIHYIQDNREINEKLTRIGLCSFETFKVRGMALNEISINYLTNKIFNKYEKTKTNTLLKQMILITGEDIFINSLLQNDNKFEETFMEKTDTEWLYYKIQNDFDLMFDIEQIIKKLMIEGKVSKTPIKFLNKINMYKHSLNNIFSELQWETYNKYFTRKIELIDKLKEIEEFKNELFDFGQWLEISEDEEKYTNFAEENLNKLERLEIQIYKRDCKNSLTVFNQNPIYKIFTTIRKIIFKPKQYEENK